MAYMSRLGIWGPGTPFREFSDFIQAVEKRYYINCYSPANQAVLNFDNDIFVFFQRSRCNGNCGNGHEGENYCILDSHYVESFSEKGVLTSSCIYV